MAAQSSPVDSPFGKIEDDSISDSQAYPHDDMDISQSQDVLEKEESESLPLRPKEPIPQQKRRRVTRACDECRRKKIKCNGKQPCTHCTVYSYECTYDQPSNRRRNPPHQYVEAVEARLHRAEALLRVVLPDINLDDPQFDVHATEQLLTTIRKDSEVHLPPRPASADGTVPVAPSSEAGAELGEESLLETMVDNSGCLDLDDRGHWDYHGQSSGIIFLRRLRKQLGTPDLAATLRRLRPVPPILDSPKSTSDSPQDSTFLPTHDLPSRAVAQKLCHNALDHGCALMRIVHEPSFYAMFDRIYDTPPDQFANEENTFLPLLYVVIAVGCLFSDDGTSTLDLAGYESAIGQGVQYFKAGRHLLDITDCRDLTSLQAICFMVLFLQSSAKVSTCYSYIGVALRSALRLGLHRSVTANFNPIERELRKRIFWVIRRMDGYVSAMLGLPLMLSDDDVDQEYPLELDDEFITSEGLLPMPPGRISLMAGANAHTRLINIILKVVRYIYPVKHVKYRSKSDHQRYMVSHSKIREIERDLQTWMEELPPALRPNTEVSPQLERIRQLLRISYAHVQMVMYRPFLHYVSSGSQARGVDKRSYACAAACVSVSRNIVHITAGMQQRGMLNGSFWFTMYTTYFAILSLIFFVLENPDSPTAKDGVLKDAMEGKKTLSALAKKSLAADRCSQSLSVLFKNLPELLKNKQSSSAHVNLKRSAPSSRSQKARATKSSHPVTSLQRSSTLSVQNSLAQGVAEPSTSSETLDPSHAPHPHPLQVVTKPEPNVKPPQSVNSNPSDPFIVDRPNPSNAPMYPVSSAPQFESIGNLPDLMPIMFPSGDPFAYPAQPMSTLEDGHFRYDRSGDASTFPFESSAPQTRSSSAAISADSNAAHVSTGPYETLSNLGIFPTTSANLTATIPAHTQCPPRTQLQSPVSLSTASMDGDAVNSPDLVCIPNQNFDWQKVTFRPGGDMPAGQAPQQHPQSILGDQQDFAMDIDNNTSFSGMGVEFPMSLDDIFGNGSFRSSGGGGGLQGDDWVQWMNVGV